MAGTEGLGSTGPTLPLTIGEGSSPVEQPRGTHNGVSVTPVNVDKQMPSPPSSPTPQRKFEDFESIDVIPEVEPLMVLVTAEEMDSIKVQAQNDGFERVGYEDKGAARKTILKRWKQKSTWKSMDKLLLKKNGRTSSKGFQKILTHMKKMSFESKLNQDMMAYYALDKHHSGQFSPAQMEKFMTVFLDRHVEARSTEKLGAIEMQLTPPKSKGGAPAYQPSPTIVLAELAVSVSGEKKESTTEAALKDLNGFMHAELYDQDDFTRELFSGFGPRVQEVEKQVTKGIEQLLHLSLAGQMEGSGKNKKLSRDQQIRLAAGVDLAVMKNIEGQLVEKRTRVEHTLTKDKSMMEDAERMLARATQMKSAMLDQIKAHAGISYQPDIFQKMEVSDYFSGVATSWIQKNVVERTQKAALVQAEEKGIEKTSEEAKLVVKTEQTEPVLPRDSLLQEVDAELAARAKSRKASAQEERTKQSVQQAKNSPPKTPPKPRRPAPKPPVSETEKEGVSRQRAVGAVEQPMREGVDALIRKHEQMIAEQKAPKK